MLIFVNDAKYYIFIHIPKNGGCYIRNKLRDDTGNTILTSYWDVTSNFDLAHIPYRKRAEYIDERIHYNYFTYTRNPYDRVISAFFYINQNQTIEAFKEFVKNILITYEFPLTFDAGQIHYYPQYLFLCDENGNIGNIQITKLESCENPTNYDLLKYYDKESIDIINRIYEKDFAVCKYEMYNGI